MPTLAELQGPDYQTAFDHRWEVAAISERPLLQCRDCGTTRERDETRDPGLCHNRLVFVAHKHVTGLVNEVITYSV